MRDRGRESLVLTRRVSCQARRSAAGGAVAGSRPAGPREELRMVMTSIGRAWSALRASGRAALARAWHAAQRWLEVVLHPVRRRRALARLAARPAPSTVVMV